jgi:hypothetical protein
VTNIINIIIRVSQQSKWEGKKGISLYSPDRLPLPKLSKSVRSRKVIKRGCMPQKKIKKTET